MSPHKKFLTGILILTAFIFVVAISSLYVQIQVSSGNACGCAIPIYLFVPLIGSMGLMIGVLAYYLLSPKFEKPPIDKKLLLNFMERNDAAVISALLENKGEMSQADIVRQTGLPKVKVFRIINSLKSKGIITKEQNKKINTIRLSEDIRKLLF
ncbi:MAG: helix-turn-helix domain-containing protein [Candidatus Aenigmatarchaeota archaeon]